MSKKSSPVWLIIFLCAVILGLFWLVVSYRQWQIKSQFQEQINTLQTEIEKTKAEKDKEIERLKNTLSLPSASASAQLDLPASSPAQLKTGEKK